MNSAGMAMAISEGKTDEQLLLIESEITKTKELINTLEKTLADQKSEMTTILAETSTIGVKTMKLMVDDYQKKVTTALQSVNTALKASNETMAFVLLAQGIAFRTCVAFADDNLSGIILDDKPEYEATEEDKPETGIDIEVGSKDVHETTNQVDSDQPLTRTIETWWTPLPSQPDHILPTKLDASVDNESATFVPFGAAVADKRNGNCAVLAFSFLILLWVFVTVAKLNALDSGWSELQSVQAGNAQRLADLRNLLR
ncbi:hypothetical protein Poli38472_013065 [Pythium oligandrum]|uniref:Uncharacterized protein n=1 Tax=Pythium oligandrum TaxID=41045 RepID=A0A8K1CK57_PYTOL|nr:hypothetical protein Poli38472_013065 [Pythium oligandrum]|eukprot:TMW64443.1 hypothetical protein Poli38472_013065 [Pythium oligandrum]